MERAENYRKAKIAFEDQVSAYQDEMKNMKGKISNLKDMGKGTKFDKKGGPKVDLAAGLFSAETMDAIEKAENGTSLSKHEDTVKKSQEDLESEARRCKQLEQEIKALAKEHELKQQDLENQVTQLSEDKEKLYENLESERLQAQYEQDEYLQEMGNQMALQQKMEARVNALTESLQSTGLKYSEICSEMDKVRAELESANYQKDNIMQNANKYLYDAYVKAAKNLASSVAESRLQAAKADAEKNIVVARAKKMEAILHQTLARFSKMQELVLCSGTSVEMLSRVRKGQVSLLHTGKDGFNQHSQITDTNTMTTHFEKSITAAILSVMDPDIEVVVHPADMLQEMRQEFSKAALPPLKKPSSRQGRRPSAAPAVAAVTAATTISTAAAAKKPDRRKSMFHKEKPTEPEKVTLEAAVQTDDPTLVLQAALQDFGMTPVPLLEYKLSSVGQAYGRTKSILQRVTAVVTKFPFLGEPLTCEEEFFQTVDELNEVKEVLTRLQADFMQAKTQQECAEFAAREANERSLAMEQKLEDLQFERERNLSCMHQLQSTIVESRLVRKRAERESAAAVKEKEKEIARLREQRDRAVRQNLDFTDKIAKLEGTMKETSGQLNYFKRKFSTPGAAAAATMEADSARRKQSVSVRRQSTHGEARRQSTYDRQQSVSIGNVSVLSDEE
eukprot:NODE_286_length_2141_cov_60.329692_g280_i0.p1 GENE.NODE_286_length_2141_cov_60.329692_g280_i0~~NODE_286_length_2141_cov_60.329692_g280_i0.p1  ORF type:complete len:707 (-),score=246.32 NODE_286_length_2141_cov_60.329692_g280_i0:19-2043(-)